MAAAMDQKYYTIALMGKTGQGKSTTGNKLLGIDESNINVNIKEWTCESDPIFLKKTDISKEKTLTFKTGDSNYSVTKQGQMLSNEDTCIRVLDMKGLGAAIPNENSTPAQVNAGIMDYLAQAQHQLNIRYDRILYFLPFRGNQKRIDAYLRDEVKALHFIFGDELFQMMIIAATQERTYQSIEFTSEMLKELQGMVKLVFDEVNTPCPPIIYVPLSISSEELIRRVKSITDKERKPYPYGENPTHVEQAIDGTSVERNAAEIEEVSLTVVRTLSRSERPQQMPFLSDTSAGTRKLEGELERSVLIRKNCTKCCGSNRSPFCHQRMVYPSEVTTGLAYALDKIMEFVFYTDKICINCQKPFGAPGCTAVGGVIRHSCDE